MIAPHGDMAEPRLRLEVIDDLGHVVEAVEVGEITGVTPLPELPTLATALAGPRDPAGGDSCRRSPPVRR